MNYNKVNNIVGWVSFFFAFMVYFLTMSPTASFWDCGEFIACSYELQVPHPPGAPFFLILGRFFALFSFGDVTQVAFWINMLSVLSSAFMTIFVFWTGTALAKKMVSPGKGPVSIPNMVAIMGAGMVAALTCTFCDSVWFNAVEAEVYALSSFFTAIVVWLMFKWEARSDEPDHLKWIILIAFLMGISIGTHLLNLLTIPALAFLYYFKKFKITPVGIASTLGISVVILGAIQYGLIQWSVELAWVFERAFTGTENMDSSKFEPTGWGMPRGTGLSLFLFLVLAPIVITAVVTQSTKLWNKYARNWGNNVRTVLNTVAWSIIVVLMGYSSYSMIVIRANAGTPINENDPSSISSMLSYLKREQYGDRPLLSGPRYNKQLTIPQDRGRTWDVIYDDENFVNLKEEWFLSPGTYNMEEGGQLVVGKGNVAQNFNQSGNAEDGAYYDGTLKDGRNIRVDMKTKKVERVTDRYVWSGKKQEIKWLKGKSFFPRMYSPSHYTKGQFGYKNFIDKEDLGDPNNPYDDKVSFATDMKFFWKYQVVHMYLRYFMWNFGGRSGDIQDMGWTLGVAHPGDFPEELATHQGNNNYFLIPLLLGLLGMVYQFVRNPKDATAILLLFFFTGLAIVLYLNQTPQQPRERDYSYAGSFQTFALWVGLSVIAIYELLRTFMKGAGAYVGTALAMIAPILMGTQNWDDHNRSSRRVAPESAYNLLNSCKKNAIIFTNGDNDTFPLWYIQEVEGVRTDVRVVNLSLLNTDWYIDQMKRQQNESPPLPISSPQTAYIGNRNSTLPREAGKDFTLPVDSAQVVDNGTVPAEFAPYIRDLTWKVPIRGGGGNSYLLKQDWMILDILATNARNGWERPIYFSSTIPPSSYIGMEPFFLVEGLANRVIPVNLSKLPRDKFYSSTDPYSRGGAKGRLDADQCYKLVTEVFQYGNLSDPDLYIDDHIRRTIVGNLTSMIFRTSNAFVDIMEYETNQARINQQLLDRVDSTNVEEVNRLKAAIADSEKKAAEAKEKAVSTLMIVEQKISDEARGNDVIFPMFAGSLWTRLDMQEKTEEYFGKVLTKAEAWMAYYENHNTKLPEYTRIMNTMTFLYQEGMKLDNKEIARQAAMLVYRDTGDPQYKAYADQLSGGATDERAPVLTPPGQ